MFDSLLQSLKSKAISAYKTLITTSVMQLSKTAACKQCSLRSDKHISGLTLSLVSHKALYTALTYAAMPVV